MGTLMRKVRDDRGQLKELYGTGFGVGAATDRGVLPRGVFRRVNRGAANAKGLRLGRYLAISPEMYIVGVAAFGLTYLVAVVLFSPGKVQPGPGLIFAYAVMPVVPLGLLAYCVLNRRGFRGWRRKYVVAAMLGERRCPGCAYDLSGARVEDDGCTVCGECGGAWKVAEVDPAGRER